MKTRIISGLVLAPIIIIFAYLGGLPLKLALLFCSLIGQFELNRAFSKTQKPVHAAGYLATLIYYGFMEQIIYTEQYFNIFAAVVLLTVLVLTVAFHKSSGPVEGIVTFFGFFYVSFLLSHIYLVREYQYGLYMIPMIYIAAFGCDTGAYFTGMAFGKHKLIPDLSPKKTVEGAIGGVIVATIISIGYGVAMTSFFTLYEVNLVFLCGMVGFLGSMLSQFGDLAASAIKRYTKIKDFGRLIPGHGGILDRFDSVLFTAPVVYYVMLLMMVLSE